MKGVLQIALDNAGNLVGIYDVKTGKDCDCYCPECEEPLEAKNKHKTPNETLLPGQKIAHFSHYDGSICSAAPETAFHLLAKRVLQETKTFSIPNLFYKGIEIIKERKPILFDNVEVEEYQIIKIKPDIILIKDNKELLIEFFKTHKVDSDKIQKIKAINKSCIEIDLRFIEPIVDGKLNIAGLKEIFENSTSFKTWLFNSQAKLLYEKECLRLKSEEDEQNRLHMLFKDEREKALKEVVGEAEEESRRKETLKETLKKGLIDKGYQLREIYKYHHYDYDGGGYNKKGRSKKAHKTYISTDLNIYCPKQSENGKDKRIKLAECKSCMFHGPIIYGDKYAEEIACGFKNNLSNNLDIALK